MISAAQGTTRCLWKIRSGSPVPPGHAPDLLPVLDHLQLHPGPRLHVPLAGIDAGGRICCRTQGDADAGQELDGRTASGGRRHSRLFMALGIEMEVTGSGIPGPPGQAPDLPPLPARLPGVQANNRLRALTIF